MKHVTSLAFGLALTLFSLPSAVNAQSDPPDMSFGNVTPETFVPAVYSLDSNANAVYLFDHGQISYDPNYRNNGYCVVYERHVRFRILNKNALGLATLTISAFHRKTTATYIDEIKATTYNLEDGKVVVTKLDKGSLFKDKNSNADIEKVAFPNVKEGSVVEYMFRIVYPGFGFIPEWDFQQGYPVLWSQYEVTIPAMFGSELVNIRTSLPSSRFSARAAACLNAPNISV